MHANSMGVTPYNLSMCLFALGLNEWGGFAWHSSPSPNVADESFTIDRACVSTAIPIGMRTMCM